MKSVLEIALLGLVLFSGLTQISAQAAAAGGCKDTDICSTTTMKAMGETVHCLVSTLKKGDKSNVMGTFETCASKAGLKMECMADMMKKATELLGPFKESFNGGKPSKDSIGKLTEATKKLLREGAKLIKPCLEKFTAGKKSGRGGKKGAETTKSPAAEEAEE